MVVNKREVISFRKSIAAGGSDIIRERVKSNGTLEELRVRFNPGQANTLRIRPVVEHKNNRLEDLVTYPAGTNQFLSGDDDYLILPCAITVENDDFVEVIANNTGAFTYTIVVDIVVDYLFGTERA
jgi:hypothetical protein